MPTTTNEFLDVPIHIVPQDAGKYSVDIHLGGGGEFYGTFAADDLLPWTSSGDLEQDGQRLFKTLFADPQLLEGWHTARARSTHRRIRLHIAPDAVELHRLPWELLHDGDDWIAVDDRTPFSRYLPLNIPWRRALTLYPIRMLVAVSNPDDLDACGLAQIDVAQECAWLKETFAPFLQNNLVRLTFLDAPVTLANLDTALADGYHLLHIIGHGKFDRQSGRTLLYFQDDDGYAQLVDDNEIAAVLRRQLVSPHLVFLSVCHSVAWKMPDALAGLGPKLIAAGVPAVVAMQDTVNILTARWLTKRFYSYLMLHGVVDRALNTARRNLTAGWRSDAAAPMLLMRLEEGKVLDLAEAKAEMVGRRFVERKEEPVLEALVDDLQKWRDDSRYQMDKRELARVLLDRLADNPTAEQIRRDIPWLLLLGVLVAHVVDEEIALSEAPVLDMLRRPREERELSTLAPPIVMITGDGNIVGNGNVAVVAKDGGTVNLNLQIDAAEMVIDTLHALGLKDEKIVARLLETATLYRDQPALPQQQRERVAEVCLALKGRALAEIRIDKDLMAQLGWFLTGALGTLTLKTLFRDRKGMEMPVEASAPSMPPSKPSPGRRIAPRGNWEPELVHIPAGNFLMGTTERQAAALRRDFNEPSWYKFDWETPQHTLYLPAYSIGKYPVTNAQYRAFVQTTGHSAPYHWKEGQIPRGKEDHPVKWLYWKDAVDYCKWLTDVTGRPYRLPTEAEWEKAARGTDGRVYPWGDNPPTERLCNFDNKLKDTTPVGAYSPRGDSPYGCADMAGNVWEWTSTRWGPKWEEPQFTYPYRPDDREDMRSEDYRVARGGSYWWGEQYLRCACRGLGFWVFDDDFDAGLRVCVAAPFLSDSDL